MHIAFVTTELDPVVPGGAGVLVRRLRDALETSGHRVTVVLAADDVVLDESTVRATGDDDAGWDLAFMARSKAAAEALADLHVRDPIDIAEVQDFDGLGFWLLTHRGDLGLAETPITVRFHGPVDLQVEATGTSTDELDAVAVMERESYAMADSVTVPSQGIRELVIDRYGVPDDRVIVGSPIVPSPSGTPRWVEGGTDLLVVGRLGEVKGSHDMVDAAVPVLSDRAEITVTFAGDDGWSATGNRPMREWLRDRIPSGIADRIQFTGHLERQDLDERIAVCLAVVVPSRFESFHLGAHEARRLGAPLIVPDLPAFRDLLDAEHGADVYDGSVPGLEAALRRACDPSWPGALADRPPPDLPDPLAPYRASIVPRHRRSQGGLATAAIARLEESWLTPRRTPPASIGRRALERVPEGVYGFAKRIVPNRIKDRIRASTDLGEEADRRKWEERFARASAVMARRVEASGEPRVSVVIPCYNQGPFVREALLSVFEQSVGGTEVVVVDDGSDDAVTGPLLDGLRIPGVRVVRTPNSGLPAARNTGIAAAAGEFVVTLDADDMLAPDYVERLLAAVEESPDIAYAHCWAELFGDTHSIWATRPYNRYQLLLSNSVVGCVLMRKAAWADVGGYDETMRSGNEDWDLWIRLGAAGYGEAQVRAPLFRYRKHGVSMSVETESRYEEVLDDRVTRHPELYELGRMRKLKHEAYPLLTVLIDESMPDSWSGHDVQAFVRGARSLEDMVDHARGKFVTWLPSGFDVTIDTLIELCRRLEDDGEAGAAATTGDSPITVVRRWSIHDPLGPGRVITTDAHGSATDRLSVGAFPRSAWQVPNDIDGVPVIRQRPEEAGFIPDWVGR